MTSRARTIPTHRIIDRQFRPHHSVEALSLSPWESVSSCPSCGLFFIGSFFLDDDLHFRTHVVFTDGASRIFPGYWDLHPQDYRAGYGIVCGKNEEHEYSVHFGKPFRRVNRGTNQRAELAGAFEGVMRAVEHMKKPCTECGDFKHDGEATAVDDGKRNISFIKYLATDASPQKNNCFRNAKRKTPANLCLMLRFEEVLEKYEDEDGIRIGFAKIPRNSNKRADALASAALKLDEMQTTFQPQTKTPTLLPLGEPELEYLPPGEMVYIPNKDVGPVKQKQRVYPPWQGDEDVGVVAARNPRTPDCLPDCMHCRQLRALRGYCEFKCKGPMRKSRMSHESHD
ncbi:hypothetical protein HDK64DRAFT_297458 [Phyllosticta capitalensis]